MVQFVVNSCAKQNTRINTVTSLIKDWNFYCAVLVVLAINI